MGVPAKLTERQIKFAELLVYNEGRLSPAEAAFQAAAPARALARLRERRNILLAETDFYALSDVTMSDDMKTYRQNLRDLPDGKDTVEKCDNVTWPTKP